MPSPRYAVRRSRSGFPREFGRWTVVEFGYTNARVGDGFLTRRGAMRWARREHLKQINETTYPVRID